MITSKKINKSQKIIFFWIDRYLFNWSDKLVLQFPGLTPHYTQHPIFPDMVTSAIIAAMIAIGLNLAMALLRRKTTNIEKMKTVMKETGEWRKKYTEAIKKKDKQ